LVGIFWYKMNSVIAVLYFNGRVYEENDGIIFEGSKKAIQINRGMSYNALKKNRRNSKVSK